MHRHTHIIQELARRSYKLTTTPLPQAAMSKITILAAILEREVKPITLI